MYIITIVSRASSEARNSFDEEEKGRCDGRCEPRINFFFFSSPLDLGERTERALFVLRLFVFSLKERERGRAESAKMTKRIIIRTRGELLVNYDSYAFSSSLPPLFLMQIARKSWTDSNSRRRKADANDRGGHVSRVTTSSCPPTFHVPTATGMFRARHAGSHVVLFSRSTFRSCSPVLSKEPLRSLCLANTFRS